MINNAKRVQVEKACDLADSLIEEINSLYLNHSLHPINKDRLRRAFRDYPCVTARIDKDLVGFAYCFGFAPDIVELANIFVRDDQRGGQIGARLLASIQDALPSSIQAIIAVNSKLHETTRPKSDPASFYLKNDFRPVGRTSSSVIYMWNRPVIVPSSVVDPAHG